MNPKPYIGVTGFMSAEEVNNTIQDIDFKKSNRLLMVGVLASSKTLRGVPNKWPNRYPNVDEIKNIFQENENCLNLIHYNTKVPAVLFDQLVELTEKVGPVCHGFQLNIAWPDPEVLKKYKKLYPDKKIVLQIGSHAFEEVGNRPDYLVQKIKNYMYHNFHYDTDIVNYLLLDPSGGLGKPFNSETARGYLEKLNLYHGQIGLGIAGGLSATTLDLLDPLVKDFPDISIDAEGRLRTQEDHLDIGATRAYIQNSLELFSLKV